MNETVLRLVVPTTLVQEVLRSCHDSLEGGHQGIVRTFHRVEADYYWIGLYADVEKHVRSCPDCSSIFAINNSQDTTRKETPFIWLDFDEELLPDDSWEPGILAGEYEVEFILDGRRPMETSTRRSVREFVVKWVGYDEPNWEPMATLSCAGLVYGYLREKCSSQRFQMVQVADED
ncbi:unnamed protein product [Phytophthora fragariaefolia]|uniref:Unnamed protein product n=1 Tax=Phytophthora fragariaefolia TaxID=1490495 RepID=A0A9W6X6F6_9STRA|nr:unnamed protein product [Phytophthora fragariaefolia]